MKRKTPIWIPVLGVSVTLAILALISVTNRPPSLVRQKNLQTQTTLSVLQQAVERFESEYAKLPEPGASDFTTEDDAGRKLMVLLMGREVTGGGMQNPRQIPFLNASVSKNKKKGGLVYEPHSNASLVGLFDAWGNPFRVILDADRDGVIRFDLGGKPQEVRGKHSLVLSKGRDGVEGTKDDVKSWKP